MAKTSRLHEVSGGCPGIISGMIRKNDVSKWMTTCLCPKCSGVQEGFIPLSDDSNFDDDDDDDTSQ